MVHDVRDVVDAADLGHVDGDDVCEALFQRLLDDADDVRRDALERRDPADHVELKLFRQLRDDPRRLVGGAVGQNKGDRLRVLVLEHHHDVFVVCLADIFKGTRLHRFGDAVEVVGRLLGAERLFENVLGVNNAALLNDLLRGAQTVEVVDDLLHLVWTHLTQTRNLDGQALNFVFGEVFVDLSRLRAAHCDDDRRRLRERRVILLAGRHLLSPPSSTNGSSWP